MARLLSIAVGIVLALLVAAQFVGTAHPLPGGKAAMAGEEAGHRSPWSPDPAPGEGRAGAGNVFVQPTVIARDGHGRFQLTGTINGRSHEFLVDTGADLVAIPVEEAAGLGIVVSSDQFRPILRTASGTANGAVVRIASLTVGGHELRDVEGVVVEGLDSVLLGQSALHRLGKVEIENDHMVIGAT